ncbi:MAG: putative thiol:disulfide interchange protein DsbC [Rhodocyclaceae bacterium]|nr:MAG: DsbC family protein [Rhodocyclaceae bacterium]MBE7423881.1 DsbC family protein [Zoogloeaceae bacterium]MBV6406993.1 putative thiol:disulfide interchange protein DsbC [Rhodocyclaceae bacterium]MCK6384074.1 DsbC family protein [Rhodocyclaceae bacterium]CAG0944570.1 putative thiol:disulfide interchange protein DsbC [Gammaproteobacteria bacterium]
MFKKPIAPLLIALSLIAGAAHANEAAVRKSVEAWLGGKVSAVRKTDHLGLYEILVGNEIYYTDEKVSLLFAGNIIDTKTRANLTQDRLNKLSAIKFSDLPLELAVKQVRGDGKRVFATFEDPNCGYCKKLAKELAGMNNVTIYTFLLPILSQDSTEKSRAVWCAADRAKAWNDLMVNNTPPAAGTCDAPTDKVLALAQKYNIRGTPTIFLSNGERIPGAIPAAQLEQKLAQAR